MKGGPIHPHPSLEAAAGLLQAAGLPSSDLTDDHMVNFFYFGSARTPVGLAGLELCGSNALLRSLVVAPQNRSSGIGAALVARAEEHAREHGARAIFLLTTTAEGFFRRRGYLPAERNSAPADIKATREFAEICPASSAFLSKRL